MMSNGLLEGIVVGVIPAIILGILTALYKYIKKPAQSLLILLTPAFVVGVVFAVGYYFYSQQPCVLLTRMPSFAITSPPDGSTQPRSVSLDGTACSVSTGDELWLMVVPDGMTAYFPQQLVSVENDHHWTTSATIGREGHSDDGKGFKIVAVYVEPAARHFITEYFEQTVRGNYIGIEPVSGIHEIANVHVIRQ
jgi:hypothetical protein